VYVSFLLETKWKKNAPDPMEIDRVCSVDNNEDDSRFYPALASDIYMLLREAEVTHSCLQLCVCAKMVILKQLFLHSS
jgi:hypothetical protein